MPLHPQASAFIEQMIASGLPAWSEMPVDQVRNTFREFKEAFGPAVPVAQVEDIEHEDGFGMRLYHPFPQSPKPVVFYFHGGGWVLGDRDTHDSLCRELAINGECVVVSVDYRRAPEHPFPTPLQDGYAAILRMIEQAGQWGIDASRIAVAGDSAGGNLAAAVALRARDEKGPLILAQLLIYPVIEPNFETRSYVDFAEGFGLTRESMQWFWRQYLAQDADAANAYAAPIQAANLDGLPRTHLITAEYDVLRDEGESYALRLKDAGVPTTTKRYEGMLHGFVHLASIFDDGAEAREHVSNFFCDALGDDELDLI